MKRLIMLMAIVFASVMVTPTYANDHVVDQGTTSECIVHSEDGVVSCGD
jgi:hypothetical protein